MTLGTTHSTLRYDGDGATTDFAVTFEFHDLDDLEVIVVTRETGAEELKGLGADYSVAGGNGATGMVTMTVAPTTAERLVIRRVSSDQQPDDLVDGGALAAEPLERRLDIITARLQELETDIARALKVTKGSQALESGLTLNLTGGRGAGLQVASDEQGIVIATGTVPSDVVTSDFGESWVGLADEVAGRSDLGLTSAAITALGTSGATIPLLNGANTYSGATTFSADATFNNNVTISAPFILVSETLAIDASGQITPTKSNVFVDTFNSTGFDDLNNIAVTNHPVGSVIKVKAKTLNQVPTLKHAVGNIYLDENTDAVLDDLDKSIWLELRDAADGEHNTGWYEVGRSWRVFPAGALVQTQIETSTTEFTITASIANDASIPQQSTNGTKVIERAVTPRFASSSLRIMLTTHFGTAGGQHVFAALFQDGTEDAVLSSFLGYLNGANWHHGKTVTWIVDAASTAARTYKVHIGASFGTMYVNRKSGQANSLGADKLQTVLTIEEIAQ